MAKNGTIDQYKDLDSTRPKDADSYGLPKAQRSSLIPVEEPPEPAVGHLAEFERKITKRLRSPLTDIAGIVKELTFGEMVQLVSQIKSMNPDLTEQSMWDWACKHIDGGFDAEGKKTPQV